MANISGDVQIETRIKHDLPIAFQSVVGEQSINVGTLVPIHTYFDSPRNVTEPDYLRT